MRPGLGWDGLAHVQTFVQRGAVFITVDNTADFAIQYGLTNGVSSATPTTKVVVGTLLRTRLVDDASPIVYGIADNMAVFSHDGMSFGVTNQRGAVVPAAAALAGAAGLRRRRERPDVARPTNRYRTGSSELCGRGGYTADSGAHPAVAGRRAHAGSAEKSTRHHSAGPASTRRPALRVMRDPEQSAW